jgi:hypothetical protein
MELFLTLLEVGFPIAAACGAGYFVFLTIKILLEGVQQTIESMRGIIMALDNRVKTMNSDIVRIDTLISHALRLQPDLDRLSRSDGKEDARKD